MFELISPPNYLQQCSMGRIQEPKSLSWNCKRSNMRTIPEKSWFTLIRFCPNVLNCCSSGADNGNIFIHIPKGNISLQNYSKQTDQIIQRDLYICNHLKTTATATTLCWYYCSRWANLKYCPSVLNIDLQHMY